MIYIVPEQALLFEVVPDQSTAKSPVLSLLGRPIGNLTTSCPSFPVSWLSTPKIRTPDSPMVADQAGRTKE